MSRGGQAVSLGGHEPLACEEFGYGIGRPDGVLVLRYRSTGVLDLGSMRQDYLHQLYWAPDGLLAATRAGVPVFVGPGEGFWAGRGTEHEVRASGQAVVYRVCLREAPSALQDCRAGAVHVEAAAEEISGLARTRVSLDDALAARARLFAALRPAEEAEADLVHARGGRGYALVVARALARDPADPTDLAGWARRLHVSTKTLQRDVERSYGLPWTRWRTRVRLHAARALLATQPVGATAARVGYASASAFVAAYAREFGRTPGKEVRS
jgi:AraC-like DNA-binding protein